MERKSIKEVLMERDGLTEKEAQEQVELVKGELNDAITTGDFNKAFDSPLLVGLESDYIEDLL